MASVRASLMTQARMAGQRIDAVAADSPVVDQLVRCAELSQDATRTLEWALDTLRAHGTDRADGTACELLRAAIARVAGGDQDGRTTGSGRSLAWH